MEHFDESKKSFEQTTHNNCLCNKSGYICGYFETRGWKTWVEDLYESSHYNVYVNRCSKCGQLYICCYIEIVDWNYGDDESWVFEAKTDWDTLNKLKVGYLKVEGKARHYNFEKIINYIIKHPHIVHNPNTTEVYWSEHEELTFADAMIEFIES